jgi:hypothetical protein
VEPLPDTLTDEVLESECDRMLAQPHVTKSRDHVLVLKASFSRNPAIREKGQTLYRRIMQSVVDYLAKAP